MANQTQVIQKDVTIIGDLLVTGNTQGATTTKLVTRSEESRVVGEAVTRTVDQLISDMASDGKLVPVEKQELNRRWNDIATEKPRLLILADAQGFTTGNAYVDALNTAYTDLYAYLYTSPGVIADLTTTTSITSATLIANWNAYQLAKVNMVSFLGTQTPAVPAFTVFASGKNVYFHITRQIGLTNFDHYEVQVSPDDSAWYALRFDGVDYKGTLNADTDIYSEDFTHTNIPYAGTVDQPTGVTLYYKVRQVTRATTPLLSSYSASQNVTTGLIEAGELTADAITTYMQTVLGDLYVRGEIYKKIGQQWSELKTNPFAAAGTIFRVASGNSVFVAVATGGELARSADNGATWGSLIATPFGTSDIRDIAYGNAVFVAVTVGDKIARSTNYGVGWGSLITNPFTSGAIYAIAYGGGVFVAGGANGGIARSTDYGVTWGSLVTNPFGASAIYAIAYGNGVFVAVGTSGKIARSTDYGVTWGSLISNPFGASALISIAYGNGVFIIAGAKNEISRSTDYGVTWSSLITNPLNAGSVMESVAFFAGTFQAGNANGEIVRSYDNGVTWGSLVTNPFGAHEVRGIASDGTYVVIVGQHGCIAVSTWSKSYSVNDTAGSFTARKTGFWTSNTGGNYVFGAEGAAGAEWFTGAIAYACVVGTDGAYPLQLVTNNAVRVTVLSGGNVGIGTAAPGDKLHVYLASGEPHITIESGDASVGLHLKAATAAYPYIRFYQGGTGQFEIGKVPSDGNFYFNNATVSGETGAAMVIAPDNKVGIGTAAPGYTLDVTGNFRCTTGFGCNGTTPQTALASGGLPAYVSGAFGCTTAAQFALWITLVTNIRAALVADGIMS